ncbi:MAG: CoA-acylating methylmalonate-semialdehyde dehydrogenase [Candidatus Micrarchaeaceae archaeon]
MNSVNEYGVVKNFVNGEPVESESSENFDVFNPAFGSVIAKVPDSTTDEVRSAIDTAQDAFEKWKKVPVTERIKYLFKLEGLLRENREELAKMITIEHGKTYAEALGEVDRAIENVESAGASTYHIMGKNNLDIAKDIDETLYRVPLGVFAVIAPFNFPLMVPFWFLPYAIGLGNTVVIKPSEKVPLSMQMTYNLIRKAGIPPGVVNVVNGARNAVNEIIANPKIRGISFVGSTGTGMYIFNEGTRNGKRVQAGMSAKNYELVMPDANIDIAINSMISSFFGNAGERCLAGAVMVTLPENHDIVVKKFVDAARKLKLGYGLEKDTDIGPLIRKENKERVLSYVGKGKEEGAKPVLDRSLDIPSSLKDGFFVGPVVFDHTSPDMTIVKEEIFGPVASVIEAQDFDSAIDIINRSKYGNAATIFTTSGYNARRFVTEVDAGNFGVNIGVAAPISFYPFAGYKDSFRGDLHAQGGDDHILFYTERKVVISKW